MRRRLCYHHRLVTVEPSQPGARRSLGRYTLCGEIAAGGMATVYLGRVDGPAGFSRAFAIKRLHPQFARDPSFVAMFLDEARIASRIRHPNVVPIVDIVSADGELFLVMDYVHGEALSRLTRKGGQMPLPLVSAVLAGVLDGLHAAHNATSEHGEPLHIVHRDVSPQNVLVGTDGVARIADFGVAKAARRLQATNTGRIKGKLPYMAPEQYSRDTVDHRVDIFAAGIVLWEALTGRRLFVADEPARVMNLVLSAPIAPPSQLNPSVPPELDAVVLRALDRDREGRFRTAREMAVALESACPPAPARELGEWVQERSRDVLDERAMLVQEIVSGERAIPSVRQVRRELLGEPSATSLIAEPLVSNTPPAPRRPVAIGVAIGVMGFLAVAVGAAFAGQAEPVQPLATGLARSPEVRIVPKPEPIDVEELPVAPDPEKPATKRPRVIKPVTKKTSSCDPPYVKGADGIVRFKRECLGAKE